MELFKAVLLGGVQGITEFLPVSSTGHLILLESLLGIDQKVYGLAFDAALHIGTLFAVLWFFKSEWKGLYTSILQIIQVRNLSNTDINRSLPLLLLIGTVPAVIIGLLLEGTVDTLFRSPRLVGISLILFSFVLLYVEKISRKTESITKLGLKDSLLIGLAQSVALVPGVSRSGITIAAGMWRGLTHREAARFAFLLSAPIIAGAGGKKVLETASLFIYGQLSISEVTFFIIGMMSAAVFGHMTIKYFLNFLATKSLYPFIFYRIILGLLIIVFLR